MKKAIFFLIFLGTLFYLQNFWGKENPKGNPGLQKFHREIKKLFDDEKYSEAVSRLNKKLSASLPSDLRENYNRLITLARKLQDRDSSQTAVIPSEKKLPPSSTSSAPETNTELVSDETPPSASPSGDYSKGKDYLFRNPRTEGAKKWAPLLAREARKNRDKVTLRNSLSVLFLEEKNPNRKEAYKKELDQLNKELIFSRQPCTLAVMHEVQPREYLSKIAGKYNSPWEFIAKINGLSSPSVRVGQTLKVVGGHWAILVSKTDFTLTVLLNGFYVKQYPVGLGKDGCTPAGTFVIETKQKNPPWYWKGRKYKYGHPKNILGTRWMGFKKTARYSGYGIHGTAKPETIGKNDSSGCVRMYNRDVEDLYCMIPRRTKVTIVE